MKAPQNPLSTHSGVCVLLLITQQLQHLPPAPPLPCAIPPPGSPVALRTT
jgi:hypothetical protein